MLYGAVRAACAWLAATWLWLLLGGARRCNERSAAGALVLQKACCSADCSRSSGPEARLCRAAGHRPS